MPAQSIFEWMKQHPGENNVAPAPAGNATRANKSAQDVTKDSITPAANTVKTAPNKEAMPSVLTSNDKLEAYSSVPTPTSLNVSPAPSQGTKRRLDTTVEKPVEASKAKRQCTEPPTSLNASPAPSQNTKRKLGATVESPAEVSQAKRQCTEPPTSQYSTPNEAINQRLNERFTQEMKTARVFARNIGVLFADSFQIIVGIVEHIVSETWTQAGVFDPSKIIPDDTVTQMIKACEKTLADVLATLPALVQDSFTKPSSAPARHIKWSKWIPEVNSEHISAMQTRFGKVTARRVKIIYHEDSSSMLSVVQKGVTHFQTAGIQLRGLLRLLDLCKQTPYPCGIASSSPLRSSNDHHASPAAKTCGSLLHILHHGFLKEITRARAELRNILIAVQEGQKSPQDAIKLSRSRVSDLQKSLGRSTQALITQGMRMTNKYKSVPEEASVTNFRPDWSYRDEPTLPEPLFDEAIFEADDSPDTLQALYPGTDVSGYRAFCVVWDSL